MVEKTKERELIGSEGVLESFFVFFILFSIFLFYFVFCFAGRMKKRKEGPI